MKKISILPSFERSVKRLSRQDKKQLSESLEIFNTYLLTGEAPFGFRFKKINHDKYEFRITIKLRVIIKIANNDVYLVLAGNHEDVKRYLKNFR